MDFEKTIYFADIISCISLVFVVIGGFFALFQWRRSIALKRASYINELTEKIRTDPDIRDMVYLFDYEQFWYTRDFHGSGEFERKVDKTLSFFSYICYLKHNKLIVDSDFAFFQYEIERILMNLGLQDYFYNLYHFSKKFKKPLTFFFLFDYGKQKKMFDPDFYNKEAYKTNNKYHRNINF